MSSLYSLLQNELHLIDQKISAFLTLEKEKDAVFSDMINYVLETPGKKIRSLLVCLSFYSSLQENDITSEKRETLVAIAAAVELIHLASLVHDDVIDDADERREMPSVKSRWGNPSAVAFGVYLYSASLRLIASTNNTFVLSELSNAVHEMCKGELFQLNSRYNFSLSKDAYFEVIRQKTADLFIAACRCGAYIAVGDNDTLKHMGDFGFGLGMLFQLSDDLLDITGENNELRKKLGQDILEGQVTLPLIYLKESLNKNDFERISSSILNKDFPLTEFRALFDKYSIREKIQRDLDGLKDQSLTSLSTFKPSSYRSSLESILSFIYNRG